MVNNSIAQDRFVKAGCRRQRSAFTLIELLAVLVIMGLLAGVTAWSVRDRITSAHQQLTLDKLPLVDRMVRDFAWRAGERCELVINPAAGIAYRSPPGVALTRKMAVLETGLTIREVAIGQRRYKSGLVAIQFDSGGASESYAVRIGDEQPPTWLLFTGRTGQSTVIHDEQQLKALF